MTEAQQLEQQADRAAAAGQYGMAKSLLEQDVHLAEPQDEETVVAARVKHLRAGGLVKDRRRTELRPAELDQPAAFGGGREPPDEADARRVRQALRLAGLHALLERDACSDFCPRLGIRVRRDHRVGLVVAQQQQLFLGEPRTLPGGESEMIERPVPVRRARAAEGVEQGAALTGFGMPLR